MAKDWNVMRALNGKNKKGRKRKDDLDFSLMKELQGKKS